MKFLLYLFYSFQNMRNLTSVEGYIVDADTGTLTISSVKRENRGEYICVAKNPAGEAKRNLDLSVIGMIQISLFETSYELFYFYCIVYFTSKQILSQSLFMNFSLI